MKPGAQMFVRAFAVLAGLLAAVPAWSAGYESLVEQGLFYLERGATYGPEAVRALEQARAQDRARADADPELLGGLARAYVVATRHTEAFWLLQVLEGLGPLGPEAQTLRERLLAESGLGRVRLVSAVPLTGLTARLEPAEGTRLDVSARKALDRLGELLERGLEPGPEGLTLLAPEGRYRLSCEAALLHEPRDPVEVEVWAGEEVRVRLVPRFPDPRQWRVEARSRSISLAWPPLDGAAYRLFRRLGEDEEPVYQGPEPSHGEAGLPVGARVGYRLEVLDGSGEVVAASRIEAQTLPPASEIAVEGTLEGDLRAQVQWALGPGAADRVRVVREDPSGDRTLLERGSPDPVGQGKALDGPFLPAPERQSLRYRVEAWVEGEAAPSAVTRVRVEVPPLVERVTDVSESIDRGAVVVVWDTVPRDGAAEGYAIYRQRGEGVEGELVGRVSDPLGREFDYEVSDPLSATAWRHFVVPYLGDRFLLDPERLSVVGAVPEEGLKQRLRKGETLPDLGLSWAPYPGARMYAVTIGEREVLVKKPYVEVSGLQDPLMATANPVRVEAVDERGQRVPLLAMELRYEHYPRGRREAEEP